MRKYSLDYDALLKRMENIVKRTVRHYQSDFYDHDKKILFRFTADYYVNQFEKDHKRGFIWIVRDCGTHLINANAAGEPYNASAADYLRAVRETFGGSDSYKEYAIQFKGGNTWVFAKTA